MLKQTDNNTLTTNEYWSHNQKGITLPSRITLASYSYFILDRLLKQYLPIGGQRHFLDIGCSPGGWMEYFHRTFGYQVHGIEYTKIGYELTKENLSLLKVAASIAHEDVFKTSLPAESFDVVYSFGVIEHFVDPRDMVAAHYRLLKPGGIMVVCVPNIKKALYGPFQRVIRAESYEGFIHISRNELRTLFERHAMDTMFCDYVGVMNLGVVNTGGRPYWFQFGYGLLGQVAERLLRFLSITKESKLLSPYIFYIGKKI